MANNAGDMCIYRTEQCWTKLEESIPTLARFTNQHHHGRVLRARLPQPGPASQLRSGRARLEQVLPERSDVFHQKFACGRSRNCTLTCFWGIKEWLGKVRSDQTFVIDQEQGNTGSIFPRMLRVFLISRVVMRRVFTGPRRYYGSDVYFHAQLGSCLRRLCLPPNTCV